MTTDRPYRSARPHSAAIGELVALRRHAVRPEGHRGADRLPLLAAPDRPGQRRLSPRRRALSATILPRLTSSPCETRSRPIQQNSIARSTTVSRGMLGWSVHQCASTWIAAGQQLPLHLEEQRALLGGDAGSRGVSAAISAAIDAGGLLAHARDRLGDLGVGGVAEQRAPRVAVLLDEAEERVDAAAQALLPGRPGLGVGLQGAGRSRPRAARRARRAARACSRSARRSAPSRRPRRRRSRRARRRGSPSARRPRSRLRAARRGAPRRSSVGEVVGHRRASSQVGCRRCPRQRDRLGRRGPARGARRGRAPGRASRCSTSSRTQASRSTSCASRSTRAGSPRCRR